MGSFVVFRCLGRSSLLFYVSKSSCLNFSPSFAPDRFSSFMSGVRYRCIRWYIKEYVSAYFWPLLKGGFFSYLAEFLARKLYMYTDYLSSAICYAMIQLMLLHYINYKFWKKVDSEKTRVPDGIWTHDPPWSYIRLNSSDGWLTHFN